MEFEGSKTALVGVNGAVARDDRTHTHPVLQGRGASL